ncbi:MAG: adenylosuccinate synthase [Candidatus Woesearchaeota archaeon]
MTGINPQVVAILGGQWGDEGKGKVVDYAAGCFDVSARATGGNNAGHTIYIAGEKHIFHLLPSSITWQDVDCLLGNGMVIDPLVLLKEMKALEAKGFGYDNLFISGNAHVIILYHNMHDGYQEKSKSQGKKIGTTKRGIGPTYADKMHRTGIRVNDLLHKETLSEKMLYSLQEKFGMFMHVYGADVKDILDDIMKAMPEDEMFEEHRKRLGVAVKSQELKQIADALTEMYFALGKILRPHVTDVGSMLHGALKSGRKVLIEGAQGLLLDIDHGTYPFVTSSNPSAGGAKTGLGISRVDEVYSIIKAYTTRVGSGPFPTEMLDAQGEYVREKGKEYGATTGRPRRCGWHDAVLTRHAAKVNGPKIIITKLDILTGLDKVKICNSYRYTGPRRIFNGEVYFTGKILREFPTDSSVLEHCTPEEWIDMPGWTEDITKAKNLSELPLNCKKYLQMIEDLGGVQIGLISVGPERHETIEVPGVWLMCKESGQSVTSATTSTVIPITIDKPPVPDFKSAGSNVKYKGIIYDMDNTLVDSNKFVRLLMKRTIGRLSKFTEVKVPSEEEMMRIQAKNLPFEKTFEELFPDPEEYMGEEPFWKFVIDKYREDAYKFDMLSTPDGVAAFNEHRQKGMEQVIVTNRVNMAPLRLEQAGYPEIDNIFSPESKEAMKPNPEAFRPALEYLGSKGILKNQILSVGDHPDDYRASKAAGLDFVAVLTGITPRAEFERLGLDKDKIVKDLGELDKVLK